MKDRIKQINLEILALEEERARLIKENSDTLTFEEKLSFWLEDKNKKHESYFVYLENKCPKTYNRLLNSGFERYMTVEFDILFEDDIAWILGDEYEEPDTSKANPIAVECLKELIENNIGSTKYDW